MRTLKGQTWLVSGPSPCNTEAMACSSQVALVTLFVGLFQCSTATLVASLTAKAERTSTLMLSRSESREGTVFTAALPIYS